MNSTLSTSMASFAGDGGRPPAGEYASALYQQHLREIRRRYEAAMDRCGLDAVVAGSGIRQYRFQDDQAHRYVADAHFLQWVPLLEHPGSAVVLEPGRTPLLLVCQPEDYWHLPPPPPDPLVGELFDVRILGDAADIGRHLPAADKRIALLGMPEQWIGILPSAQRNPEALVNFLHFHRATKTDWEVHCMRQAARIAAPGHRAAAEAFRNGESEYGILYAFLGATAQTEEDLPYGAIIALNHHAATLHYQHRDRQAPAPASRHSLLIDAGCAFNGYACDITRTHAYRDDEFAAMVDDMSVLQRELCEAIRPGIAYPDLHRRTHHAVAGLLNRWGIARMEPEDLVKTGVTFCFFPHGLGHLLGIQVHDVGGHMGDEAGTALAAPEDFPKLRFLRRLEPGQVVTVEPGIYFIESLLARLRTGPASAHVDWPRIENLKKYGGIRIEDDILVTTIGAENLTRQALGD